MSSTENEILQALTELDTAVKTLRTATPKPDLQALFGRIDSLSRELPRATDPLLLHYLTKKSYEKARLFLEGRDAENAAGNCHGHRE
jgi:hypothetical protein